MIVHSNEWMCESLRNRHSIAGSLFKERGNEAAGTRGEEVREFEFAGNDLFFAFFIGPGVERCASREQFEAEYSEAPEICIGVVRNLFDDFGWDVVWSAAVGPSKFVSNSHGPAEVGDLQHAVVL